MYSIYYQRPTGETVQINSEFQPQITSPYNGMIFCAVEGYKILVPSDRFCSEYKPDKKNSYEKQMEELLHG